jgi:hypothetical protein
MLSDPKMRVSIISIIVAILLAASSAALVNTRQPSQLCVLFTRAEGGNAFFQCFPPDGEETPFGNQFIYFFTSHRLEKDREF